MTAPEVIGPVPRLPGAVGRWLTAPIPAERLAAFRIGAGLVLLVDLAGTYLPFADTLLGPGGYITAGVERPLPGWKWSVLRWLPAAWGGYALLGVWLAAAAALTAGVSSRLAAAVAWACAASVLNADTLAHNGGDRLRPLVLLTLALCPAGAVWAADGRRRAGPVWVSGWPARLMLVQLCCVYFFAGLGKLASPAWHDGTALRDYAAATTWCAVPGWGAGVPLWAYRLLSLGTVGWEVCFPVLAVPVRTRGIALAVGAVFHVGTAVTLEVGMFPWWALCCYLPLLPWERLTGTESKPGRG